MQTNPAIKQPWSLVLVVVWLEKSVIEILNYEYFKTINYYGKHLKLVGVQMVYDIKYEEFKKIYGELLLL